MPIISSKDLVNDSVKLIAKFQSGNIKPIQTGIDHLDENLLGGLFPSTVLSIVGLSSHGKTYFGEQIKNNILSEYADDVIFIDCLWELEMFKILVRDISKTTGVSIRSILTEKPNEIDLEKYKQVVNKYRADNIYVQPEPVSYNVFMEDISLIIEKHKGKKIVVMIDNLENILVAGSGQKEAMDELVRGVNILKKQHPFISFIILNQLNRELENRENPANMFPRESDIYGTASLFKLSDVVVAKHLPYRLGIKKYGVFSTNRYQYIPDEFKSRTGKSFDSLGVAFYHYLKSRGVEEEYDKRDLFCERIFEVPKEESSLTDY